MGSGVSRGISAAVSTATDKELKDVFSVICAAERKKVFDALASIEQASGADSSLLPESIHRAVLFIKPHAVTDPVKEFVKTSLAKNSISIESEGSIYGEEIDSKGLIDSHYGSIASRCMRQKPSELVIQAKGQADFEKAFGKKWDTALADDVVCNGEDAAARLGVSTAEIGEQFVAIMNAKEHCKLGGGCYAGKIGEVFVINGFYYRMRAMFTEPGSAIHYFLIKWNASHLSWADFRSNIIGATDATVAVEGSLRNSIWNNWETLGLKTKPGAFITNSVHGSASPFEGLVEKANWLGTSIEEDDFTKALVSSGVSIDTVKEWTKDPVVTFEGKESSLFDLFENLDVKPLLAKAKAIVS